MWILYYKNLIKKIIDLYLSEVITIIDLWVVLDNVLPFLCTNFEVNVNETKMYKEVLNVVSEFNPDSRQGSVVDHNYLSEQLFNVKIREFRKVLN